MPNDALDPCPHCGHAWARHAANAGCSVRVDSAWTPDNTRRCGCQAIRREDARSADAAAPISHDCLTRGV